MSRRQRGVVSNIDYYEHQRFKIKILISLNKETGKFFAEYSDKTFYGDSLQALKDDLFKFVEQVTKLKWQPIIQVEVDGNAFTITDVINDEMHGDETYQRRFDDIRADLMIKAKRYWIGQRPDGKWMKCEIWDSRDWAGEGVPAESKFLGPNDRRINAHEFYEANHTKDFAVPHTVASRHRDEGNTHYLPYDESMWTAFNAIGDKIRDLNDQLQLLVGTDHGRLKLASFAQRMLPAPAEGKKRS